jgi:uncharacterized protein
MTRNIIRRGAGDGGGAGLDARGARGGRRRPVVVVAVAALAAGATACGTAAGASAGHSRCTSGAPQITVEASGQASATPDVLTIDIGVSVSDPTASSALSDANDRAATLTQALGASGVTATDIQSTDFSITPDVNASGTITGYQVSNTMLVTVHDLAGAGKAIDTAAQSVGNAIRINGLTFGLSAPGTVDGRARANAIETAAAHARAMTAAAGESLGGICSISDSTTGPFLSGAAAGANTSEAPSAAVPLEPGIQQSTAQVTVVYAIASR